jgi:class 3 adenylate cyclase
VLALFPSADGALRAARRLRDQLDADDLRIRVGVHVGDVDRRGDDVSGLAVNIAARVMARAGSDEIAVTSSVIAATTGQGMEFEPIGAHDLKGVPGTWDLYRLVEA